MKFSFALTTSLIAIASKVVADSENFLILSLRSASPVHFLTIHELDGNLILGSGDDDITSTVTDDGKLKFSTNQYAVVGADGKVSEGSEADASTGFSIANGALNYKGSSGFYAVPVSTGVYSISVVSADNAIPNSLSARDTTTGTTIPDFTPNGDETTDSASKVSADSTAAATATVTSTSAASFADATTTSAAANNVAAISQIADGQIQAQTVEQQSENGVSRNTIGGSGMIAVALAMLL